MLDTANYEAPEKPEITSFLECLVAKLNLDPGLNLSETKKNGRFLKCPKSTGHEAMPRGPDQGRWPSIPVTAHQKEFILLKKFMPIVLQFLFQNILLKVAYMEKLKHREIK